ncbi:MAG: cupin domain-containing protein [Acidobacteriota bacterium]|nr:cupin domain-containing protein [Acidobacteriota bacterium]
MLHMRVSRVGRQLVVVAAVLAIASVAVSRAEGPRADRPLAESTRARQLIRQLQLHVLPRESGYLGIVGISAQQAQVHGRSLAVQSQNYYMLTRELPINYLHWLEPDDTHILVEGGPVDYFIFCPGQPARKQTLGMDLAHGERPIVAVPGGCWKALQLRPGAAYALTVNTLSPEFTPDRVRIGEGAAWVQQWAGSAPWATPEFLRTLIGPNWKQP